MFTNQLREKIGVMFGNPETTPGGRALKFYASVRLDIRRVETIKTGTESVGNRVRVKVVKNKVVAAVPRRRVRRDVRRGHLHARAACSTSAWRWTSSRRPAPGSRSARRASARAARRPRSSSRANADIAAEIDRRIRAKMHEVALPVEGIEEAE